MASNQAKMPAAKWLVTGASGFLGSYVSRTLAARSYPVIGQFHSHEGAGGIGADLTREGAGLRLVQDVRPSVVVNCAALTNVDLCEKEPGLAKRLNADLCGELASACNDVGAALVMVSTDQLWRNAGAFVREETPPEPAGAYGASKADGETQTRDARNHLVLRTNFFGRGLDWKPSLSDAVLNALRARREFTGFTDVFFTPIAVGLAAGWIVDAVEAGLKGTFHLGGRDRLSKFDFAVALAKAAGLDSAAVKPIQLADAKLAAARPREMSLCCEKISQALGRPVPGIGQSLSSALA